LNGVPPVLGVVVVAAITSVLAPVAVGVWVAEPWNEPEPNPGMACEIGFAKGSAIINLLGVEEEG
jgi:hypothetical protein